jgi:aspartate aminotransferase-like enzyme
MAGEAGSAVALDCVSSLGAVPIGGESESLLFASGVSGKALGSFAGLAFVYLGPRSKHLLAQRALPRSFDLFDMRHTSGPASTIASPLLFALGSALEQSYGSPEAVAARFEEYKALGEYVREQMRALGLHPLAAEAVAAPNVTTFPLPSPDFPQKCLATGFTIAHESSYLLDRGWGQIATMGHITPADLEPLFRRLRQR